MYIIIVLYTYRYRLYPTPTQEVLCNKHFGCNRFVYNYFLYKRVKDYHQTGRSNTYLQDKRQLPILKQSYQWLAETGSQSLQYVIKCLQTAYDRFFKKLSKFPKCKKKFKRDSFHIAQKIKIVGDKLMIPKFREGIPVKLHRKLEGEIRHATVSRRAGRYQVAITVDKEIAPLPKNDKVIGLDLNVKNIVDDVGSKYANPRPAQQYKDRLRLANKKVSRKVKGSIGRKKACGLLARIYEKVRNIREDFLHKLTKRIVDENQVICVEDLRIKDMTHKVSTEKMARWEQKRLHRDVLDCGFYSFVSKLTYKALWYGRTLLRCDRWFPSSQLCNHCNWQYKDLEHHEREWTCWNCWENNDRDVNAACNVKDDCLRTAGNAGIAVRPVVRPGLCLGT